MSELSQYLPLSLPEAALGQCNFHSVEGASEPRRASQSTAIVASLRLDNHNELCLALDLTQNVSDDQVLYHAWERWGPRLVDHLIGGFAFACWVPEQRLLFLARDHGGERPLHFAQSNGSVGGGFAFASNPLALCELPEIGHRIDVEYMARWLAVADPNTSQTCFHGVERLLPGHCASITPNGVDIQSYWHPSNAKPIRYRRDADYIDDFRERFDRAVGGALRGSTGVASDLSAGLDSSSVTVTAARLLAQSGQHLTSFTSVPLAGFDGSALPGRFGDEGTFAAEVAALYPNINHVIVNSEGRDLIEDAAQAARCSGIPTFNPANQLWVNAILEGASSRGANVLLQGAAGNTTISLGGLVGLSDLFKAGRWFTLFNQTRKLRANGHTSWRAAASWATGPVMPNWMRRWLQPEMHDFTFTYSPIHPDRAVEYRLKERATEEIYGHDSSTAALRKNMYEYYDPGLNNLAAAARWQMDLRDPTQNKLIYEFCFGIPIDQYLVGGQSRSLIRRAMQGQLPETTLRRTTRGLQAADWYLVMGGQLERLAEELRRVERYPLVRHLIDVPRLHALLEQWPTTGYNNPEVYDAWHLALSRGIAAASFLADHGGGT